MKHYLAIIGILGITALAVAALNSCGQQSREGEAGETGQTGAESTAADTLREQADRPETLPLVPMMRLLLDDVYTVDEGIYLEDYEMIEKGAGGIADHPVMTEEDKVLIKSVLGEEMPRFVSYDMTVHHHADSMRAAAGNNNMAEVLRHYNIVQQGCVDCHADFRTRIQQARQ